MAKGKGTAEAATRRKYRIQIVTESLTGQATAPAFQSKEMLWGVEQEKFARASYELLTNTMVDQVGFVLHPTIERAGASPDGLIGFNGDRVEGLLEVKCPNSDTHLGYILDNEVPVEYQPQMLWQMACCEAPWCDFVSFDPRMPEHLQLFVKRFYRDEARIKELEAGARLFLSEIDALLAKLKMVRLCLP